MRALKRSPNELRVYTYLFMQKRGVAKNTTYFTLALVVQKILSFIYFYLLSANILPDTLGKYVFALSYASLFSIFIDLGLTPILIRESSKNPQKTNTFLKNIIAVKIPLACIVIASLVLFINLTGKPLVTKQLVYLAAIIMSLDAFTMSFWAVFRSFQNLLYESVATILVQIIIFVAGISALFLTKNIIFIILALVAASIFNFLFSVFLLKFKLSFSLKPEWDSSIIKYFLKILPAFALGGIFVKVYNASDAVMLGFFSTDHAVGLYSVPAKTITALSQVIPFALASALFPVFSKNYIESKEKLKINFLTSIEYLIIASFPIAFGLMALIPYIVKNIWPKYIDISTTFIIMSLAIPFIFLSFSTGYLLNATDRQKYNMLNRGIMSILTIVLNFFLIPFYSYLGAGITFLFVNVLVFILDFYRVGNILPLKASDFSAILTKTTLACIIMIGVAYALLQYMHFILVIAICAVVYLGILLLVRAIKFSDIKKYIQL